MDEYLTDLTNGSIGGVSLVDHTGSLLTAVSPTTFWSAVVDAIRETVIWFIDSMSSLSSWIRDTPAVMAVAAIFFFGFCIAIFMRVYHSIL